MPVMEKPSINQYYNELVVDGHPNVPSMTEAAKDLAQAYAYVIVG